MNTLDEIVDKDAPAPKPDMLEEAAGFLRDFINAGTAKREPGIVPITAALLAVAAELRDIHNVLHEINQHMAVSVYGADALRVAEDAPDPNQCPKCLGEGVVLDEGRNVQRCEWCHGKGRVWS